MTPARTLLCIACLAWGIGLPRAGSAAESLGPLFYQDQVAPILRDYCAGCHNEDDLEAQFSVETYQSLMEGGESGPVIVPGNPTESLLLQLVSHQKKPRMPPRREPQLSQEQIRTLTRWVESGAAGPPPGQDRSLIRTLTVPGLDPHEDLVPPWTAVAYSPDGAWTAWGRYGTAFLKEAATGRTLHGFQELPGKVNALRFNADGTRLVIASGVAGLRGEAMLWEVATGRKILAVGEGHGDILYDAELSPDETLLATAGYDRKITLWEVATGRLVRTIEGHHGAVYDLAFSPDGTLLGSASADETIKLWKVATGERLDTLNQPQGVQYSVAFTPDGAAVAGAGEDNRIRLWRLLSRETPRINPLLHARFAHEQAVLKIAITPDGTQLVSTAADRTTKLWSLPDLRLVEVLQATPDVVTDLALHPKGNAATLVQANGQSSTVQWSSHAPRPADPASVAGREEPAPRPAPAATQELQQISGGHGNHSAAAAQPVPVPSLIQGVIAGPGEQDYYRFQSPARAEWTMVVDAARRGSALDAKIEVLNATGQPVERVVLQAIRDSWFTFRGKDSETSGDFRLQNWREMELNEYLYANGEVVRLWHYPRGPDSGFIVYPGFGARHTQFGTTALSHPLGEPCYVVRPLPAGTKPSPNGLPVFRLHYENDDDPQRRLGRDSRLLFTAPEDGDYLLRIGDVRGFGGDGYHYQLSIRPRRPDFRVVVEGADPSVSPGSGREFTVRAEREDGFAGEIQIDMTGLPEGFHTATPLVIEAGQDRAMGVVYALPDAPAPEGEEGRASTLTATAWIRGRKVVRQVGTLGNITLGPPAKLRVEILADKGSAQVQTIAGRPLEFTLAPGETITARVRATRVDFDDRIEFGTDDASRNLPHGVYIDNIGLNGLLIVEGEDERQFSITAASWVPETTRFFHLRAKGDGGQVTRPALLHVKGPPRLSRP